MELVTERDESAAGLLGNVYEIRHQRSGIVLLDLRHACSRRRLVIPVVATVLGRERSQVVCLKLVG